MTSSLEARHDLGRSVTVTAGDLDLFTYTYRPDTPALESPKPYLHPVRTLAGDVVTLFRPHDHVWHKGIAWSLPHATTIRFRYAVVVATGELGDDGTADLVRGAH